MSSSGAPGRPRAASERGRRAARVLVVEDDEAMAAGLRDGFELEGYEVRVERDGVAGLDAARDEAPDLLVLDVMLPKMNGLEVLRILRSEGAELPVIMLTAKGQEIDKVLGLRLGADDYVTKPFGLLELLARVEALLRRSGPGRRALDDYTFGSIRVEMAAQAVYKGGRRLDLSPREFELLRYLIAHRGSVVRREELLDAVWGYDRPPLTRTVDVHVAKLRRKIEDDPAAPEFILTVHRVGYRFLG